MVNLQEQVLSLSPIQGNVITFTVLPDQTKLRSHITSHCKSHGWEDNKTQTFDNWLDEQVAKQTQSSLRYYATVVPCDEEVVCEYTYPNTRHFMFDKFLEKTYEEQETGWLYEVRPGLPETFKDKDEVKVLNHSIDDSGWEEVLLGVITPMCI